MYRGSVGGTGDDGGRVKIVGEASLTTKWGRWYVANIQMLHIIYAGTSIFEVYLAIERATTDNKHGEGPAAWLALQYDSEGEAEKYRLD